MQPVEPFAQIEIVATEPALADQGRELGGLQRLACGCRIDHHAGKSRRQRQAAQMPALLGHAAVAIDGAEFGKERFCFVERGARRRVEEGEFFRLCAPSGEVEREGRQIRGEDFRPRERFERRILRLVPQPVANPRLGASGAAAALIGRRPRHSHGLEPCHADVGFVARHARQPGIDHDAHALDGDRGFGDRCCQHDLAAARRGREDGAILLLAGQCAVERDHIGRRIAAVFEERLGAADFGGAGQEHKGRARIGAHRARDGVGDLRLDGARLAPGIAGLDRKGAALAFDHRRAAQKSRHAGAVDGRRHHHEF